MPRGVYPAPNFVLVRGSATTGQEFSPKLKTLKFSKELIPAILAGEKTTTWRCFDDKDLKKGDELLFLDSKTKESFAKVVLVEVEKKTFRELDEEGRKGHEKFENDEEMLKTYSEYYRTKITSDTPLKIIKFKILEKI